MNEPSMIYLVIIYTFIHIKGCSSGKHECAQEISLKSVVCLWSQGGGGTAVVETF